MKKSLLLFFLLAPFGWAQTSKELLANGLFAEEASGDLKTATEAYESLLKSYEVERKIAATALFRLAEIRDKEENQAEAVRLLKRLLVEFPGVYPNRNLRLKSSRPSARIFRHPAKISLVPSKRPSRS